MKSYVAMCQCPVCGNDSGVAINRNLKDVFESSDRVPQLCSDCEKRINAGYCALIETIGTGKLAVRTGNIWFVKKEALLTTDKIMYVEKDTAVEIGLYAKKNEQ